MSDDAVRWVHFDDMAWPDPQSLQRLERTLRYDMPRAHDWLAAASVINAYRELVLGLTAAERAKVLAALRPKPKRAKRARP
jgi:hypothetical protein